MAFFDLGNGEATTPDPGTPRWVNHLALEVDDEEKLLEAKKRLEDAGVDVLGATDHGFVKSIYFFDPNEIRLELTCRLGGQAMMDTKKAEARGKLNEWLNRRATAAE